MDLASMALHRLGGRLCSQGAAQDCEGQGLRTCMLATPLW